MSERKFVQVREVMKKQFDLVDRMDTVKQALSTMKHVETKCLIVRKRDPNDAHGMVLLSDIARKVLAKDLSADRINVYEVMAKPILHVEPSLDIRYCARLFDRFDISRAPVVENGEVIGIVSFTDLVIDGVANHL
jgi:CBS domain-containing protein